MMLTLSSMSMIVAVDRQTGEVYEDGTTRGMHWTLDPYDNWKAKHVMRLPVKVFKEPAPGD